MQVDSRIQTERLRERLEALNSIGLAVGRAVDLNELCQIVFRETTRIVDTTGFILGLYDQASQTVRVVYQVDSAVELPSGSFPLGSGFTSQVIQTRVPRLIRHWSAAGPRVQIQYATAQSGLPESGVIVPLLVGEQVIGVLSVQSYRPEAYDEDDLLALQTVGNLVAIAIQNLRVSKRLDVQLQRRVSELEAVLESMTDALLIVDAEGRIIRLNRAARELLCTKDTGVVLGQPLDREQWGQWPLGARAVAEALEPVIQALREGEALHDVEVTVHGQGRQVLSFSCAPLRDPDGTLVGGLVMFRDVTSRRDIERLREEVLSIASHDLKNPVTVIKGQIQLLRRHLASDQIDLDRLSSKFAELEHQTDRLAALIDLLLDFSHIETGQLELQPGPTDLVGLARSVLEGVQTTTDRHRLILTAPERLEGLWDEQRVEQVLRNLLTNAVKYSPDGGTVEVVIETDERHVTVCVRDEGLGLAADETQRIFERFYRAKGARRLEGSGLGLYICNQIITVHGGRIWAESEGPGRGSTFCFTLPRRSGE